MGVCNLSAQFNIFETISKIKSENKINGAWNYGVPFFLLSNVLFSLINDYK